MKFLRAPLLCLLACFAWTGAYAQSAPPLDAEGMQMIEAVQKAMTGDYKGAESAYSSVLATNPRNIDAYLQRGVIRRELKNSDGAQSDGTMAARLASEDISKNPPDATAYHQRGTAFRLLGNYAQAKQDINASLSLGGDPDWKNDLRDTALEEKASQGIR